MPTLYRASRAESCESASLSWICCKNPTPTARLFVSFRTCIVCMNTQTMFMRYPNTRHHLTSPPTCTCPLISPLYYDSASAYCTCIISGVFLGVFTIAPRLRYPLKHILFISSIPACEKYKLSSHHLIHAPTSFFRSTFILSSSFTDHIMQQR